MDHKESWGPKNWCFCMSCWWRHLRGPWTARRSTQSFLKEISPGCSLEGLTLKLKLQYFGHLIAKNWLTGKDPGAGRLKAGEEGGDRGWDGWMASPTRWTWVWASSGSWWWTGKPGVLQSMGWQRVGHNWATELTELKSLIILEKASFGRVREVREDKLLKIIISEWCRSTSNF